MNDDNPSDDESEHFEPGQNSIEDFGNARCTDPNARNAYVPHSRNMDSDGHQDTQIQEYFEKSEKIREHVLSNFESRSVHECFASDEESGESAIYGSSDESNNGIGSIRRMPPINDAEMNERGISFSRYFGSNNKKSSFASTIFKLHREKYKKGDVTKKSENEESIKNVNLPNSLNTSQEMPSTSKDHIFLSENFNKYKRQNLIKFESSSGKENTAENNPRSVIPPNSVSPAIQSTISSNEGIDIHLTKCDGHFTLYTSQYLKYHSKEVLVGREYEETIQNINQAILDIDLNMDSSSNGNFSESSEISLERVTVSDFDSSEENKALGDIISDVGILSPLDSSRDNIRKNFNQSPEKLDLSRRPACKSYNITKDSSELFDSSRLKFCHKKANSDYPSTNTRLSKAASTSELQSTLNENDCNAMDMSVSNSLALPHRKFRSTNLSAISEFNSSKCKLQHVQKSRSLELTGHSSDDDQTVDEHPVLNSSFSPSRQRNRTKGFSAVESTKSVNCVGVHSNLSQSVCYKYPQRKHKSFQALPFSDSSSDESTLTNTWKRREYRKKKKALPFHLSEGNLVVENADLCKENNEEGILGLSDSPKLLQLQNISTKSTENDLLSVMHEVKFTENLKPENSEGNRVSRKRLVSNSKIPEMEKSEDNKENKKFKRSRSTEK